MPKLDAYVKRAKSLIMSKAKIIDVSNVVVANWVRMKCQFGCGGYGECLTCPPYSPTPEMTKKMLQEYRKGLLIQVENIPPQEEDKIYRKLDKVAAKLERELFLDGYYKAFGLTAGPCSLCRSCDTKQPCKHPRLARPSMEACGIDVYQTARNCGFTLQVVKSRDHPCSYLCLILIE